MSGQVNDSARVAPFVIVPRNELGKVRVEGDTGLGIEDGRARVLDEVLADNVFISVTQDTLELVC